MRSSIFRPRDNIDLNFDLNKGFNKIQLIEIALILDLKIQSLTESKHTVEHIQQALGSETITKDDLLRNSDGKNLLHSFQMSKIQEHNDIVV